MRKFGRLREKIKEMFGNQKSFAQAMNMNISTLSFKLNSRAEWTLPEIEKACELLNISIDKVNEYFFYE